MGLPLRLAVPLFIGIGALFLAVMLYFVRVGLGNGDAPLGITSPAPHIGSGATPAPLAPPGPGTFSIPQTGTGPAAGSTALPGKAVGGGS